MLVAPLAATAAGCRSGAEIDRLNSIKEWSNFFYVQGANPEISREEAQGAYLRSQRLARMYLEEDPRDILAATMLGYTLLMLGPWRSSDPTEETAESVFQSILDRDPRNYRANMGMGMMHFQVARREDRGRLDDFSKALQGLRSLKELVEQQIVLEESAPEQVTELDRRIAVIFHDFSRDLRQFTDGPAFPWERFKSLVSPEDIAGTRTTPTASEVRRAIRDRVENLLKRMEDAQKRLPPDNFTFLANLERLEVLLRRAFEHYRARYVDRLDRALGHFHLCVRLHDRYQLVYHWIYEYMALSYLLKASVYDRRSSTTLPASADESAPVATGTGSPLTTEVDEPTLRGEYMERAMRYFHRFHDHDRAFERRRIERLRDPRIAELRNDPFWTHPTEGELVIEDYRALMRDLIDQARRHRRGIVQMMIDLHLHEFETYEAALPLCDYLADAEVMLNDVRDADQQMIRHLFFRAEIRRYQAERLERSFPKDELGNLVLPSEGDEVYHEHRSLWQQANRHYREFLGRASLAQHAQMRDRAREAVAEAAVRFPEFVEQSPIPTR